MFFVRRSDRAQRIALVDCNNFYVSCERVFRPTWEKRPLGVLSNNDGCLVARSNELKEAGIPMGAPYFKHRDQLESMGAVIVSSNYSLYGDMSSRVMDTLGEFTPDIEVYSIDEAWLDLSGFNPAIVDAYGREIAAITQRRTGIPVSIGIGPTKVLAKIANLVCKKRKIPGQVFNLGSAQSLDRVLDSVEVKKVWGIGRRWGEKLRASGIYTARDLRDADPDSMCKRYNVVMQRLILELRGVRCLDLEDIEAKKQIIVSRSFGKRAEAIEPLLEAVSMYATRAGEKLRLQDSVCGTLQVFIRTGRHNPKEPYYSNCAQIRFSVPTADTRRLIGAAREGVKRIFKPGLRYLKAGVILMDISPAQIVQVNLFHEGDSEKTIALMGTMDHLNERYGRKTMFFASEGTRKEWAMKRQRMTPAYTTNLGEVPVVR